MRSSSPPMFAEIDTNESTTSGAYVDLTTPGPSLTVPPHGLQRRVRSWAATNSAAWAVALMSPTVITPTSLR